MSVGFPEGLHMEPPREFPLFGGFYIFGPHKAPKQAKERENNGAKTLLLARGHEGMIP
jgi:hypothetical protein